MFVCVSCGSSKDRDQVRGHQTSTSLGPKGKTVGSNGETPWTYPTPAAPSPSTTVVSFGTPSPGSPPSALATGFRGDVSSCPARYPERISNVDVTGLGTQLVPIDATKVRICRYRLPANAATGAHLEGAGMRSGVGARRLRDEVNALRSLSGPHDGDRLPSCVPAESTWFLLTFAADDKTVVISQPGCPYLTNNALSSEFAEALRRELAGSVVSA
jgi:hypothetical protein